MAARLGNAKAATNLGVALRGEGGSKTESNMWLETAGKLGSPEALFNLSLVALASFDNAGSVKYLELAATSGHIPATYNLAHAKLNGVGTAKDVQGAGELLGLCADAGDLKANSDLRKLRKKQRIVRALKERDEKEKERKEEEGGQEKLTKLIEEEAIIKEEEEERGVREEVERRILETEELNKEKGRAAAQEAMEKVERDLYAREEQEKEKDKEKEKEREREREKERKKAQRPQKPSQTAIERVKAAAAKQREKIRLEKLETEKSGGWVDR